MEGRCVHECMLCEQFGKATWSQQFQNRNEINIWLAAIIIFACKFIWKREKYIIILKKYAKRNYYIIYITII